MVNLIQDEGITLEGFVTEAGYRQADNGQTRRLSGQEPPFGETASQMLDTVKQQVETGQITAGTLERFTDTLGLFSDRLGWQLEDSDQSSVKVEQNVNPDRASLEDMPTRVLNLIRERNALHQELYDFVEKQLG